VTKTERDERSRRQAVGLQNAIAAMVRRFSLSERADVSCCGMTVAQAATLGALREEGPMRSGALGSRLGIRPSTLTRNLERLEDRGLIRRETDPEDARASRVRLTPRGRGAAKRVEAQEVRFAEAILGRLPAGRRDEVLEGVHLLLSAVRGASEACCGGAFDHLIRDFPRATSPTVETPVSGRNRP
jgi:DNA-binding MarR family transcriptional regulator